MMIQTSNRINYCAAKNKIRTNVLHNKLYLSKDTVSFRSFNDSTTIPKNMFSYNEIFKVKELFENIGYGVDLEAILQDDNFQIRANKDNLVLYNFVTQKNSTDKIIGRCKELTYKLGKKLECLFGDKYEFYAVSSYNHYFLAVCKKGNGNINPKKNPSGLLNKLPNDFFYIDPTTKKYGTNSDQDFDSRTDWELMPLESMNPFNGDHSIEVRYYPFLSNLVIGSVQRLFDKSFSRQFLKGFPVSLEFYKDNITNNKFKVDVKVKITGEFGEPIYCSDEDLIQHSPILFRTVERIRSKLQKHDA